MLGIYEEDLSSDCVVPYYTLLGGGTKKRKWWQFWKPKFISEPIPQSVVDFLKSELFNGIDADIIDIMYQRIKSE